MRAQLGRASVRRICRMGHGSWSLPQICLLGLLSRLLRPLIVLARGARRRLPSLGQGLANVCRLPHCISLLLLQLRIKIAELAKNFQEDAGRVKCLRSRHVSSSCSILLVGLCKYFLGETFQIEAIIWADLQIFLFLFKLGHEGEKKVVRFFCPFWWGYFQPLFHGV